MGLSPDLGLEAKYDSANHVGKEKQENKDERSALNARSGYSPSGTFLGSLVF